MIYIKRQKNSLNLQSDTERLDDGIITILNKLQDVSHFNIWLSDLIPLCLLSESLTHFVDSFISRLKSLVLYTSSLTSRSL